MMEDANSEIDQETVDCINMATQMIMMQLGMNGFPDHVSMPALMSAMSSVLARNAPDQRTIEEGSQGIAAWILEQATNEFELRRQQRKGSN